MGCPKSLLAQFFALAVALAQAPPAPPPAPPPEAADNTVLIVVLIVVAVLVVAALVYFCCYTRQGKELAASVGIKEQIGAPAPNHLPVLAMATANTYQLGTNDQHA